MKTRLLPKSSALFLCCCLASIRVALGSGTVANCTQSDLEAALAGGGTVLFACSGTITLTNTLVITQDALLDANGSTVTISGGNAVRLFQVRTNVKFSVNGLTLANGSFIGANGANGDPPAPGQDGFGAGVLNQGGTVTLVGCTLTGHLVQGGNAGQDVTNYKGNFGKGGNGFGAAICSVGGTLSATNCSLTDNTAIGGQGSSSSSPGYTGSAGHAFGGAIYCESCSLNLETMTLIGNVSTGGFPQLQLYPFGPAPGGNAFGGAIYATNSTIYIGSSQLASNTASGPTASAVDGGTAPGFGGALFVSSGSAGVVRGSVLLANIASGGNRDQTQPGGPGFGGAIFNGGELRLMDDTFSNNTASGGSAFSVANAGQGGAVYSTNSLVVNGCTFNNNSALGGQSTSYRGSAWPAGVGQGGGVWSSGSLSVTNSTWAANQASGGQGWWDSLFGYWDNGGGIASGGGLFVTAGTVHLVNVTLATNRADGGAGSTPGPSQGGGLSITNCVVTVRNSVIAKSGNGGDVWGSVTDAGYNLCSDGTAQFTTPGSLNNTDPLLAALSYNGGPNPTMALLVGSPARDAIPSGFPPTDQRGVSRPQGPAADIGAFEADFISSSPRILTQPQGLTVRAGTNVTFTVVASGTEPLFYQWSKGSNLLSGATAPSLSLTNVQAADPGAYSVLVTNNSGSASSTGAVLVVDSKPLILTEPI